jgi:hypothetical protein
MPIFIPGFIIALLTFPGIIVHEFAHKLFCQWTRTRVLEVCYFRFGNPAGFVVHENPTSVWKHILIDIGPFFINTFFGFVIGLLLNPLRASAYRSHSGYASFFLYLISWIGFSIAMNSFPSIGDAMSIWSAIRKDESPISAKILGTPLVGLIYIGAIGSVYWLNLFYAAFIVVLLPLHFSEKWWN